MNSLKSSNAVENRNSRHSKKWFILAAGIVLFNLIGLGAHGLLEPDEGRYANMALEWLEFSVHNWAEPTLSDVGHFDKPPLVYWICGTCLKVFGSNETAARLPSFLGSLLALTGVGLLAFRQYGEKVAFWSVIICATTIHFWALAHLLSPDMLLCGFCTLGTALCLRGGSRISWILGALFWTLAWWTKATAALVPLGAISIALLITGRRDLLKSLKPLRLLLVILVLGCPWYIAMMMRHRELVDFFLHREVVGRIAGHADGRKGFPGYHFVVALGFWLPWWPLLAKDGWDRRSAWLSLKWKDRIRQLPWEIIAALLVLLIFSFVSSKLITYTITGLPFLAIAVGKSLCASGYSERRWPVVLSSVTAISLFVTGFSISYVETSLGRNSSLRTAVAIARENGATRIACDSFLPGLKFYMGENVWYVNVADITQVQNMQGQAPSEHFVSEEKISQLVRSSETPIWLIQTRKMLKPWESDLIENRPDLQRAPITVGDFILWKVN